MAGNTAQLGIAITVDDSGIKQLMGAIAKLSEMAGGSLPDAFEKASTRVRKASDDTAANAKKNQQDTLAGAEKVAKDEIAIKEKASQSAANAALAYTKLKNSYEDKSVDHVRSKIMELEETTRTLRRARSMETDNEVRKELQTRTNGINAELQLYRSLEKEKTGARTFMEGMEKLSDKSANAIKTSWAGTFKNIVAGQGQFTAEVKKAEQAHAASMQHMAQAATAEAKAEAEAHHAMIEKELADIKHRNIESKEHAGEGTTRLGGMNLGGVAGQLGGSVMSAAGPLGSLMGPAGLAAGLGAALTGLIEKGKAAAQRAEELKIGLMSSGMGAEEADKALKKVKESAKDVSHEFALNKADVENAMAVYLKMGGTTDNLKQKQEDIAALARKSGVDMDMAAKMYAKAGDPEISANLKKFGIDLSGVTNEAERAKIIHQKLAGTLAGMKEAANSPLAGFQRMQASIGEITGAIGSLLFEALGPLFSLLGEIGKFISDYIVPVVKVLIDSALFPLRTGINLVMGALKLWWELFTTIYGYIGEATGITKALTDAWTWLSNAVSSAIQWFTKAKDTVSNLGTSLLSMLGITKKSTEADKENEKSKKDVADATQKATKASDDYTASLIKNTEESIKNAKQGQDNAIAAIVDIQSKLKTATGAEKALLEQRLAQWKEYGKKQVAEQEATEKAKHEGALAIGAAVDADQKKAVDKSAKIDKDAYTAEKNAEDIRFTEEKITLETQLANKVITKEKYTELLEEQETVHVTNLKTIADNHRAGHEKDVQQATEALLAMQIKANEKQEAEEKKRAKEAIDAMKQRVSDRKAALDEELTDIQENGEAQHKTERQIRKDILDAKQAALKEEIVIAGDNKEEVDKLNKELQKLNRAEMVQERKDTEADQKEINKLRLDSMKDGFAKKQAVEQERYEEERKKYADNADLLAQAERTHSANVVKIKQEEIAEVRKTLEEGLADIRTVLGVNTDEADKKEQQGYDKAIKGARGKADKIAEIEKQHQEHLTQIQERAEQKRYDLEDKFGEKMLGISGLHLALQAGQFTEFLKTQGIHLALSLAAQVQSVGLAETAKNVATSLGQAKQTALVVSGFVARQATYVAEGIASAASAAGTWIATAAKATYNAFEMLPFPIDIVAAAGAVAGVYELSSLVSGLFAPKKLADGAVLTKPTFAGGFEAGEAGHEAAIPLNKYPGMYDLMDGGISDGIRQLNVTMQNVHNAVNQIPTTAVLPPYSSKVWQSMATKQVNQRKMGA